MVCLGKKNLGSFSRWILPGFVPSMNFIAWSRIWSIYVPVWPIYLHSSFLSKQQFFCRLFEISSHGKFRINPWFWDSVHSFFPRLVSNLLQTQGFIRIFPDCWFLKIYKIIFAERSPMKILRQYMLHMSGQSWNNSWASASRGPACIAFLGYTCRPMELPNCFLPRQTSESSGIFCSGDLPSTTQHKTGCLENSYPTPAFENLYPKFWKPLPWLVLVCRS